MSRKAHPLTRPSLPQFRRLLTRDQRALLDAAYAEATSRGVALWLVGGAVRDLVLGRAPHDLDLALRVDPRRFATAVAARLGAAARRRARVEAEARFGTASLRIEAGIDGAGGLEDLRIDFARLRREQYATPGALPTVTTTRDIEVDLGRRDFNVNAMALRLTGERADAFIDPWHGLEDLAAHRLRVLHPRSFIDDPTRLWRGARTAAISALAPDEQTARLIAEGARHLDRVSGKRIAAELRFTAARGHAGRTLALAEAWGVLHGTHPALHLHETTVRALRRRTGAIPFDVFMALLVAPLEGRRSILVRLTLPRAVAATVEDAARLLDAKRDAERTPEALARLTGASEAARIAARWLAPGRQPALLRALTRWERTRSPLDAAALLRLGIPRGPRLGETLDGLRRARYLGTLTTTAEARRAVQQMVEAHD